MRIRQRLSYVNVVATLALFLTLGGGAVWAATKIHSGQLATNAVKGKNIARSAVSSSKVKDEALGRAKFVPGTFSALPVTDVSGGPISPAPGFPLPTSTGGTPIPLSGTPTFTPAAGHAYLLQAAVSSKPVEGASDCLLFTTFSVNGRVAAVVSTGSSSGQSFPNGSESTAVGLTTADKPQTITARSYDVSGFGGNPCGAGTIVSVRADVIDFG
jgi:hypothetical protein